MSSRKRRRTSDTGGPGDAGVEKRAASEPTVVVSDTGDARAEDGGTAVTGYRGPAPDEANPPAEGRVQVSETGDATATEGGIAITGSLGRLTLQQAPRPPVSWPHWVGVLPAKADAFQHREVVDALDEAVAEGGTAVLGQVLAGTGGVGKTQLAAHYARRSWQARAVELLVWVTAASREAIVSGYAQAGVDVAAADPAEPEQAADRFLSWLETTERRWLVVLDDLADPAHLRGLWPPHNPVGRVLVTTRRRDDALTGHGRRLIEVGLFTPTEATDYLAARLTGHGRREPVTELAGLAHDLGRLPLALAQAAAYLLDLGLEVAGYRRRLADRRRTLAELVPDDSGLPDDQRASLAATWSLSIERADRLRPVGLARPMLELASMLDPNGIPETVLSSQPALAYLATHRTLSTSDKDPPANEQAVSSEDAGDALRCLQRLSLVEHTPQNPHRAVRVHNLIQRATREAITNDRGAGLAKAAADALLAAWPEVERDTSLAQTLRANTDVLTAHADQELWRHGAHPVLSRSGESLGEAGLFAAAIAYWEQLHTAALDHLGPDHHDTLATRAHVAFWQGLSGDAVGAAAATEQLLVDTLRVLGPDHPNTLRARSSLARWQGMAGDGAGAMAAYEELVEDRLRVLGPDHPDTLLAQSHLAYWRGEAGDGAGAMAAYEELVEDRLRVLGPDHPDTLATRGKLAGWQGRLGDPAGAAAATEQLLEDYLRVLGPDHPDTVTTMDNLAFWREATGEEPDTAVAPDSDESNF
jgi:NB-ARC domain/Tetratricopeptide repeat